MRFQHIRGTILFFLTLCWLLPYGQSKPLHSITIEGSINDMVCVGEDLFCSGDRGTIYAFGLNDKKLQWKQTLPLIEDFMGDLIAPSIISIDKLADNKQLLVISQGKGSFRNIFMVDEKGIVSISNSEKNKWMISEGFWLNQQEIILTTLGSELIRFNIISKKVIYRNQIGSSTVSDACLNKDKSKIAIADEAGIVNMVDVKTGVLLQEITGQHVDNIYQIDWKENIIVCGGRDRRLSFYQDNGTKKGQKHFDFMIFSVALDSTANLAAHSFTENNEIKIINASGLAQKAHFIGHSAPVSQLIFHQNYLISCGEDSKIHFWKLPTVKN